MRGDTKADPPAPAATSRLDRILARDNVVLFGLLLALSYSFYYGWFGDNSHPIGGRGWADQNSYRHAALRMAHLHLPLRGQLRYAPSYSMLGALGSFTSRSDPFWIVSYGLLIGSAVFLYRGARAFVGTWFAAAFLILVFAWDFKGRKFEYSMELFVIAWNNQMLFFAFAFFFWLYATRRGRSPVSLATAITMGVVVGLVVTAREESVAFLVPLAAFFLWHHRAPLERWLQTLGATVLAALPGVAIKYAVLGGLFHTGRKRGYSDAASTNFFSPSRLWHNTLETIVHSDFAKQDYGRISLFEANKWLWVAPIGLAIILFGRRFDIAMKFFVLMSLALMAFYLSGKNVSALRLRYHCLRYMAPGYIALNFGVIVFAESIWNAIRRPRRPRPPPEYEVAAFTDPPPDPLVAASVAQGAGAGATSASAIEND